MNCLTINTDASFNLQQKVGGYAFYIVCDLFKIQKGGMFKKNPESAIQAEMMCMANAIHTIFAQKELPKLKLIVINSDCLFSFGRIKRNGKDKVRKFVAESLRKLRLRTGMPKFEFRHVKAHTEISDARSFVNDWCDKEAKKWTKIALQKLKNK